MRRCLIALAMLVVSADSAFCADAPIRIAGALWELTVHQVSERTLRFELSPLDEQGKTKVEPASTVLATSPLTPKLRSRELPPGQELIIGRLSVAIKSEPLTLIVCRADGTLVQELKIDSADGGMTFHTEAPVFGLGEGRQQFDRRGFYYNFVNGQTTFLNTHSATIPVPFLIGADGWAMFVHNPPPPPPPNNTREANQPWGVFDLRGENAGPPPASNAPTNTLLQPPATLPTRGRFIPRKETLGQSPIQVYIIALDKPADALEEYMLLSGRPVMPPKWVMGYMQSHRSLAGPEEPIQIAQTFRDKQLPVDAVIYLGTGYTNGDSGWNTGHGSLTFNPKVFDKPQEMVDKLHNLNLKIVLHKNAAPAGLFGASVNEQSTNRLHISNYWATHVPLVKMGIDAWWPDDGDELPIEARLARHRLYYEGSLKDHPDERPWSLNRNGYAGAARYGAWIWSGDVQSRWVTLANHIPVGLNFSLSVSPFWGSDTGGFFLPPQPEYTGELWVRWFQYSAFTPLFRSHGRNWHLHLPWGWDTGEIGPRESGNGNNYPPASELHNKAVEPICKKFLELRYQLLPYNYTLVREACDTGLPPMRALWLAYPDDAEAVKLGSEYLWGPDMLVAPVVEKGATTRRLYLPAGDWYDWWTGERLAGKKWIDRPVDLATLPLYVRAGAIIPLDPIRQYTAQSVNDPTTIIVHPGANGSFVLYDDDGHTMGYQTGADAKALWIKFSWNDAAKKLTIEPDPRMKQLPGGPRVFQVRSMEAGSKAKMVEFSDKRIEVEL